MQLKTKAIVISNVKFGEADLIVKCFTLEKRSGFLYAQRNSEIEKRKNESLFISAIDSFRN